MVQPLWKTVWSFLKKLKTELSYDPEIPLLSIYPEKMKTLIQKDTCTSMLMAALLTTDKTWKQPKCPSTEDWIKMWLVYTHTHTHTHTHTMEYYSAIKKNEILPFAATWMDLESNIMFSEISLTEKDKCCMISLICGI